MAKARNHSRYELRDKGKIVYVGITRDPERREEEHKDEGKPTGDTGQVCIVAGFYSSSDCNCEILVIKGEKFPPCLRHGREVTWTLVRPA